MKATNAIHLLASTCLTWAANVDRRVAEAECGALGVMEAPASAYANGGIVRKCRDHPLGNSGSAPVSGKRDESPLLNALHKRCNTPLDEPWGCSNTGYCWKACGQDGEWCWTAGNYGNGNWATCSSVGDCGSDDERFGCSGGCGC
ncbi:protein kinase domain protein [Beauveria brongniartii RCEF 3172]|uniref:Protein kinase domain protein n=1 Tax=Beauveria brongniartii RCEF 3172 TaxID=1081107 RepID=A0A166YH77_9HYPO|nr:protein kinase domain protein [Beauveria brongniartii RCEF 3172]